MAVRLTARKNQLQVCAMTQPGEQRWTPTDARLEAANLTLFTRWLERERGLRFADYAALWRWSVEDLDAFWGALFDYFRIDCSAPPTCVLGNRSN